MFMFYSNTIFEMAFPLKLEANCNSCVSQLIDLLFLFMQFFAVYSSLNCRQVEKSRKPDINEIKFSLDSPNTKNKRFSLICYFHCLKLNSFFIIYFHCCWIFNPLEIVAVAFCEYRLRFVWFIQYFTINVRTSERTKCIHVVWMKWFSIRFNHKWRQKCVRESIFILSTSMKFMKFNWIISKQMCSICRLAAEVAQKQHSIKQIELWAKNAQTKYCM